MRADRWVQPRHWIGGIHAGAIRSVPSGYLHWTHADGQLHASSMKLCRWPDMMTSGTVVLPYVSGPRSLMPGASRWRGGGQTLARLTTATIGIISYPSIRLVSDCPGWSFTSCAMQTHACSLHYYTTVVQVSHPCVYSPLRATKRGVHACASLWISLEQHI